MRSDRTGDEFFRHAAQIDFPKIFPDAKLERLPYDHPIFHCFHHFKDGIPHMQGIPHGLHGVTLNGRLAAVLSPSDIHCGWTAEKFFGPIKQQQAVQMGTNIYLYAMTNQVAVDRVVNTST